MSEQFDPWRDGPLDEERNRKAARRQKPKPTLAEFPVGRVLVAEFRTPKGRQAFFRVRVVDSYEGPTLSHWYARETHLRVFVRIEATTDPAFAGLLGHLANLADSVRRYWFGHRGLVVAGLGEAELAQRGHSWVAELSSAE